MLKNGTTISVAMIACNEEKNLPRTLDGVRWADEVVIVDSGSEDSTPEIARSYGARFSFNRDFRGHGEQKNIAIGACVSDWVLLLDADEVVTPELAREIQAVLEAPKYDAYWVPRLNLFLTKWLRHGGMYPDKKLRLFKRGAVLLEEGVGPHATPQFAGQRGSLKNHMLHYAYPDFGRYLEHMNNYSSNMAGPLLVKYQHAPRFMLLLRSWLHPGLGFVRNYFIRLGFLDGTEGLIFHFNHAVYVHWKYVKAWEARGKVQQKDG